MKNHVWLSSVMSGALQIYHIFHPFSRNQSSIWLFPFAHSLVHFCCFTFSPSSLEYSYAINHLSSAVIYCFVWILGYYLHSTSSSSANSQKKKMFFFPSPNRSQDCKASERNTNKRKHHQQQQISSTNAFHWFEENGIPFGIIRLPVCFPNENMGGAWLHLTVYAYSLIVGTFY